MLFTAHNVPLETVMEGDPYVEQLQQTVAQLLPALMPGDWRLAFQSKGRRGGEWLEPEAVPAVHDLAAAGWKNLLVVPLGFVADHVETLYDLDVELRDVAESCGMDFLRSRALNDAPLVHRGARRHRDRAPGSPPDCTGPSSISAGAALSGPGGSLGFGGPFGPGGLVGTRRRPRRVTHSAVGRVA